MKTIDQEPVGEKITITLLPEGEAKRIPFQFLFPAIVGTITGVVLIFSILWGIEILLKF